MAGTDQLSAVFSALADPTRRAILAELAERDATVTELTAPLSISMPAVSRHLKVLERAALISRSRSGKWRASHLEAAPLREAADWIERYRRFWDSSLTRLDAHLAAVQAAGPGNGPDGRRPQGARMNTETPQLVISRVFDAPRELVYRAFTDPDHLAAWWGPIGNSLPRDEIEFDVRPGGYQRWTEVNAADPDLRVHIHVDLTDVADGELLEGVMHVSGRLQEGVEPFETRLRVEFHDEADGRTRLEIRQWLPEHLAHPSEEGWRQAFTKLDATLMNVQSAAADHREVAAWQS